MNPAIVINAYNRPQALERLLRSVQRARYPQGPVSLVISIDRDAAGIHPQVLELANAFRWDFGEKRVLPQAERLGMTGHFYRCGDLSAEFGAIVYLEDDLLVSPVYYHFAAQALEAYASDPRIGLVCLYGLWFNGYTQYPFIPLNDDSDAFFLQIPYHQGQAFTYAQWQAYREWLSLGHARVDPGDPLHPSFQHFAADEWFPARAKFLVETGRTTVYPRQSVVTSTGAAGTHFAAASYFLQTPLQRFQESYRFKPLDESVAVYDSFFELLPDRLVQLAPLFKGYSFDVDLNGTKMPHHLTADYALTTRPCKSQPLFSFHPTDWPLEANVFEDVAGEGREKGGELVFCKTEDLAWGWLAEQEIHATLHDYYTRHRRSGLRTQLRLAAGRLARKYRRFSSRRSRI